MLDFRKRNTWKPYGDMIIKVLIHVGVSLEGKRVLQKLLKDHQIYSKENEDIK